jgi:hypothetical protein
MQIIIRSVLVNCMIVLVNSALASRRFTFSLVDAFFFWSCLSIPARNPRPKSSCDDALVWLLVDGVVAAGVLSVVLVEREAEHLQGLGDRTPSGFFGPQMLLVDGNGIQLLLSLPRRHRHRLQSIASLAVGMA